MVAKTRQGPPPEPVLIDDCYYCLRQVHDLLCAEYFYGEDEVDRTYNLRYLDNLERVIDRVAGVIERRDAEHKK